MHTIAPQLQLLRVASPLVLTVGAAWVVFSLVDLSSVSRTLGSADLLLLALAAAAYLAFQGIKTIRVHYLIGARQSWKPLFVAVTVQGAGNIVLPTGLGEVLFVWLLRRLVGVHWGIGLAAVLLSRLADATVLAAAALGIILTLKGTLPVFFLYAAIGLLVAAALGALLLVQCIRHAPAAVRTAARIRKRSVRIQVRLLLRSIRRSGGSYYLAVLSLLTVLIWSARFLCHWAIVVALNLPLTLQQIVVVYLLSFSISLLPIRTVANIGPFEGIWVLALVPLGFSSLKALEISVAAHFGLLLVTILSTGCVVLLYVLLVLTGNSVRRAAPTARA
jgi:uncharacterized protein (TIRG00374 family)